MVKKLLTMSDEEEWKDRDFLTFDNDNDDDDDDDSKQLEDEEENVVVKRKVTNAVDLPPWMTEPPRRSTNHLIRLHNEIVDFCKLMEPRDDEIKERSVVVEKFKKLALDCFGRDKCEIKLFGSQATGLFLPTSDIDLVVLFNNRDEKKDKANEKEDEDDMEKWRDSSSKSPLFQLADALREKWRNQLSYLEVIENTRVPLVKLTVKLDTLPLHIDVCFNQDTGPKAAQLMTTFLKAMPPLRPLTFVLKYFLASRGMNEPYSGGIGSYLLQLMIVSFLQHRERDGFNFRRSSLYNLGTLLIEFLELYGLDFNYVTTGFSVRHDGFYFSKGAKDRKETFWNPKRAPLSIGVENPLEPTVDVGTSSFKMSIIQRSFETAFKVLLAHVSEPILPANSILSTILPPTQEMRARAGIVENYDEKGAVAGDGFAQDALTPEPKRRRLQY